MSKTKRGIELSDLSPAHREQAIAQIASQTSFAFPAANGKSRSSNEPLAAKEAKRHHRPYRGRVSIHFSCRRSRLADADGDFYKWFVDALVDSGVLQDDSSKFVSEISHKASTKAEGGNENMTIEIWTET